MEPAFPHADDFAVGWLCALSVERAAAEQLLDEQYHRIHDSDQGPFVLGRIGGHHVVIGCLPEGFMGTSAAVAVAADMKSRFKRIQHLLMVGIAGGVPSVDTDVRLGDVVIGLPGKGYGGVVQYDFGKAGTDDQFQRTGFHNAPPKALLDGVTDLRTSILRNASHVWGHLHAFDSLPSFTREAAGPDNLYQAHSTHVHGATCENCRADTLIRRSSRPLSTPVIHYGTIASGNQVIKDAITRDRLSSQLGGVLCFEMEAAGLMNEFQCLVIRGICDYADSHKNKSWQPYAAATAAATAKEILSMVTPATTALAGRAVTTADAPIAALRELEIHHGPAPPRSIFMVPFSRDLSFVGRKGILDELHYNLSLHAPSRHRRTALIGLGGIGKSQVAIEYAYRVQEHAPNTSVFWIHASNPGRFRQGYQEIADRANLPGRTDPKTDVLELVHRWLTDASQDPWLIILDNVDDDSIFFSADQGSPLEGFLPHTSSGTILVTSRSSDAAMNLITGFGEPIELGSMSESEGIRLLATRISLDGYEDDAKSLVQCLESIPLAIIQAAAYIKMRKRFTVSRYLQLFQVDENIQTTLLDDGSAHDLRRDFSTRDPVMTAWQITFNQIRDQRPSAADLLALMSMYDRQSVPSYLLQDNRRLLQFEDDLAPLLSFCLVREQTRGDSFEMHRLVQLSTRKWLDASQERQKWRTEALRVMANVVPQDEFADWPRCQELLPHMREVFAQGNIQTEDASNYMEVSNRLGQYLCLKGQYTLSLRTLEPAVDTGTKELGPDHPLVLTAMTHVACAFRNQGRWEDSEGLAQEALRRKKRVLGTEHSDTIRGMVELASVYLDQKRLEAAEQLNEQVVEIGKRVLDSDDSQVLAGMHNLATTYWYQERFEKAEELDGKVLELRRRVRGHDHPETLHSMSSMAATWWSQGKWHKAEELEVEVLETQRRKLGIDHPETLVSMHNLACTWKDLGRDREAIELLSKCLRSRSQVLGPKHPETILSGRILADWQEADQETLAIGLT